ncbi:urease accessory protein UreF [Pseudarthrobacter sp. J75]|uniref:urease accessory protein UreF n=1 Tax=unclassified Pseudarthrobacter TaxID=2647000 RepID=UPI002E80AC9C|nr:MULTISPECIES: urease accessory protein UreF [unclassified Pseudarthrobacter]MEE2521927.1 urease accessory protein UreF [Pseudarthrobacter sp. J47]MEE2528852.1 urease accessory protein UreF [Pseudarthrobacter sp. J75]
MPNTATDTVGRAEPGGRACRDPISTGSITGVSSYQLALQQLTDSALPTGAFAHSLGFEGYIERGAIHDEPTFGTWLAAFVAQQLTYSDGLAIRFLYEGVPVGELDAQLTAQLLPRQVREASTKMGGRLLEIGHEVFPSPALEMYRDQVSTGRAAGHQPLAFAVVARSLGVPLPEALAAYLFATVTSLTQNAVRAIPLGQNAGQRLLREAADAVAAAVQKVPHLAPDDFGAISPGLEISQMRHERQRARMFMS